MLTTQNPKPIWRDIIVNNQALSLFRILFSCMMLFDLCFYVLPHWDFLYSSHGAFMGIERKTEFMWSFMRHSDSPLYQFSIVSIYVVALFGLLVGYRARLCAFIGFVTFKMIIDRNPASDSGAELLEILFFLWCSFVPTDRYWSIAAASRADEDRKTRWPIIPLIALKGQILLIYLCSGTYKVTPGPWSSGEAINYALSDQIFGSPLGQTIVKTLPLELFSALGFGIIVLQLCFSAFVYLPLKGYYLRAVVLCAAACMHIGFIFLLQLHLFPILSLIYLILLFPDEWITKLLAKRRQRLEKIKIYYDPDCGFCKRTAFVFKEFCLSPFTSVQPSNTDKKAHKLLQEHNSWIVYGVNGEVHMKWRAVAYVLKQSPVFFVFGYVTDLAPCRPVMEKLYHAIGHNRSMLGRISKNFLKPQHDVYLDRTQQWICLVLFGIAASYALWSLPPIKYPIPQDLYNWAHQTGVQQDWDLFAPNPASYSYNIYAKALDADGRSIPLDKYMKKHYKIKNGYLRFQSPRVLKYYSNIFPKNAPRHRKGYARYLCWQTLKDNTPAHAIELQLNTQHNFHDDDKLSINTYFDCDDIMHEHSRPNT